MTVSLIENLFTIAGQKTSFLSGTVHRLAASHLMIIALMLF